MQTINLTPFQKEFIERLSHSYLLGKDDKDFQSNAEELIGRINDVINLLIYQTDEAIDRRILDFFIDLQFYINKCKQENSPEPLVRNLFKNEWDCLKAFRYVSIAGLEIHGIALEGNIDTALNVLWSLQEIVNFPLPEEIGVLNG